MTEDLKSPLPPAIPPQTAGPLKSPLPYTGASNLRKIRRPSKPSTNSAGEVSPLPPSSNDPPPPVFKAEPPEVKPEPMEIKPEMAPVKPAPPPAFSPIKEEPVPSPPKIEEPEPEPEPE